MIHFINRRMPFTLIQAKYNWLTDLYFFFNIIHIMYSGYVVRVMVFNATVNNVSVISWRSVLLLEETGVSGENHRPAASH